MADGRDENLFSLIGGLAGPERCIYRCHPALDDPVRNEPDHQLCHYSLQPINIRHVSSRHPHPRTQPYHLYTIIPPIRHHRLPAGPDVLQTSTRPRTYVSTQLSSSSQILISALETADYASRTVPVRELLQGLKSLQSERLLTNNNESTSSCPQLSPSSLNPRPSHT